MGRLLDEDDVVDWLLKRTEMYDGAGYFVDENVVKKNIESQIAKIPTAQPEIANQTEESAQNVQNEDLISRKAAIDAVVAEAITVDSHYFVSERIIHEEDAVEAISMLPSAQPEPMSEAYAKAVFTWLLEYQIKAAELNGRYTPYEVLSWVANDWRKENGFDRQTGGD